MCEGLEQRLTSLPLHELDPPLKLNVVDIDDLGELSVERARYDLEVPVLAIQIDCEKEKTELPRVSPRLDGIALMNWLQKIVSKTLKMQ